MLDPLKAEIDAALADLEAAQRLQDEMTEHLDALVRLSREAEMRFDAMMRALHQAAATS